MLLISIDLLQLLKIIFNTSYTRIFSQRVIDIVIVFKTTHQSDDDSSLDNEHNCPPFSTENQPNLNNEGNHS